MSNKKRLPGRPAKYPPEFQRDAVAMVLDEFRSIADVARSIGVDSVPCSGGLSGVMPGVAQVPVVMPVAEVLSVSRVVSSSASELSVR